MSTAILLSVEQAERALSLCDAVRSRPGMWIAHFDWFTEDERHLHRSSDRPPQISCHLLMHQSRVDWTASKVGGPTCSTRGVPQSSGRGARLPCKRAGSPSVGQYSGCG